MAYEELAKDNLPASLYGALALRQHRLNQAVGIRRVTPQVELLLVNYQIARQREQEREYEIGFKLGSVAAKRARIKQIMVEAKSKDVTKERLIELLAEAHELQASLEEVDG